MGDRLLDILKDMQVFVYGSVANLPLCIGATMLLFGLFTCNYAMLFFLIGFLLVTPLIATAGNTLAEFLKLEIFKVNKSDVCGITTEFMTKPIPSGASDYVIISNWFAMMLFFCGYIFMNALQMISKPESVDNKIKDVSEDAQKGKLFNLRSQASTTIGIIVLLLGAIIVYRYSSTCEPFIKHEWWLGGIFILLLSAFYIGGGVGWYHLLSLVGEDRLSDLFGIANRLLPPGAFQTGPMACLPVP